MLSRSSLFQRQNWVMYWSGQESPAVFALLVQKKHGKRQQCPSLTWGCLFCGSSSSVWVNKKKDPENVQRLFAFFLLVNWPYFSVAPIGVRYYLPFKSLRPDVINTVNSHSLAS